MASLEELNQQKTQYETLKNSLNNAIPNLEKAINYLNKPVEEFNYSFKIDGVAADKNLTANNLNTIINEKNYIVNTIIPAIDNKIIGINGEIEKEQQRLENDRKAREEAERQEQEKQKTLEAQKRIEEIKKKDEQEKTTPTAPASTRGIVAGITNVVRNVKKKK